MVETIKHLHDTKGQVNLKDLHDNCPQAKKHKTIRQYGSILRLKGEYIEYTVNGEQCFLVGWREGPEKIYALSDIVEREPDGELIVAKRKIEKLKTRNRLNSIRINHRP